MKDFFTSIPGILVISGAVLLIISIILFFIGLMKNKTGKTGIKNFRFGEIITDIILENGICTVKSNRDYTLNVDGIPFKIHAGKNEVLFPIKVDLCPIILSCPP